MRVSSQTRGRPIEVAVHDLVVSYGRRRALCGVTFAIEPGCTALLGPNGAGKTTLLEAVATIRRPTAGRIIVDGEPLHSGDLRRRYRARLGYLPQEAVLPLHFTAREVLEYAAWLKRVPATETRARITEALARTGLSERAGDRVRALSGGMRRRLGIAQTLVGRPALVLLDEPTVGLDPAQRATFRDLVTDLAAHSSVLLSTHLVEDVVRLCTRAIVLHEGLVRCQGRLDHLARAEPIDGAPERPGHPPDPESEPTAEAIEAAYLRLVGA